MWRTNLILSSMVVYDHEELSTGEITEFDGAEIRANVMRKSGKFWKWASER